MMFSYHKPILRLLFAIILSLAWTCSWAQQVKITDEHGNKLYYTINGDTAVFSRVSYSSSGTGTNEIVIADEVVYDSVAYPVTAIDKSAFYHDGQLGKVTIGNNVKYINNSAFYYCSGLKDIIMGDSVSYIGNNAFYGCDALQEVDLTGVESIGQYAFYDCDRLKSVELPDLLEIIPGHCFCSCDSLTTVTVGECVTEIGEKAFSYTAITSFDFNEKVSVVRSSAFYNCKELKTITGISAITVLESSAFSGCNLLAGELEFPALKTLGDYTFQSCNELIGITLGDSLASLKRYTFENCSKLDYVHMPSGLTNVSSYPFSNVGNLKRVYFPGKTMPVFVGWIGFPDNVMLFVDKELKESYRTNSYTRNYRLLDYGSTYTYDATLTAAGTLRTSIADAGLDPANLVELSVSGPINGTDIDFLHGNMPSLMKLDLGKATIVAGGDSYHRWWVGDSGVATKNTNYAYNTENDIVGDYMFYNMPFLKKLVLPQRVTKIGKHAVADCFELADIEPFPSDVALIDQYAFYDCNFPAITFGASLDSIGAYAFYSANIESITIPEKVRTIPQYSFACCDRLKRVELPDGLLKIGAYAFYDSGALDSINLPATLEIIGDRAFYGCSSLKELILPDGLLEIGAYAFSYCSKVKTVTLPDGIIQLPEGLFSGCSSLQTVNLSKGTTGIGAYALDGCSLLENIDLDLPNLRTIGNGAFAGCDKLVDVMLSNTITSLGYSVFSGCDSLKSINIPTGITTIPRRFVVACSSLTSVKLHDGVFVVSDEAFNGCSSLVSLALPETVTTIGSNSFSNCTKLEMDKLPVALTTLGSEAFSSCKAITISCLPDGLTSIGYGAFLYSGITSMDLSNMTGWVNLPSSLFQYASELKEVKLPPALEKINSYAFEGCKSLTGVILPESLKEIEYSAFSGCELLEDIEFPAKLTSIGYQAFASSGLRHVFVPDSVTTLGSYAFAYNDSLRSARLSKNLSYTDNFDYFTSCDSLNTLRIYAGTVPSLSTYNSNGNISFRTGCVLEVPKGTEELYMAADYWKEFKEINGFLTGDKLAAEDYAVLKDLYSHLNGEGWTNTWDLSTDDRYPGKWYGVVTEGDHIVSIDIAGNGHKGTIPASVFGLSQLKILDLSDGEIDMSLNGLLKDTLDNSVLQKLYLQENRLKGDVTSLLAKLPALTYADLRYNILTEVSASLTGNKLRDLYLGYQFYRDGSFIYDNGIQPVDTLDLGIDSDLYFNSLQRYDDYYKRYGIGGNLCRLKIEYHGLTSENALVTLDKQTEDGVYRARINTSSTIKVANDSTQFFSTSYVNGYQPKPIHIRYVNGDINIDRLLDVADLASLILYLTKGDKPSGVPFNYSAADWESNDTLDVRDIVMNVNRILDADDSSDEMRQYAKDWSGVYDVELGGGDDGCMYLSTDLSDVSTIQIDLRGCHAENLRLASGLGDFTIAKRTRDNGAVRVVIYSASGMTFGAGTTKLLKGIAPGSYVVDAVATDVQAGRLKVNMNGNVTGIEGVDDDGGNAELIYDLSGRRVKKNGAGVYIINGEKFLKR